MSVKSLKYKNTPKVPKYPKSGFHISVLDFYGLSGGLKATSKRPSTNFVPIGHKSSFAVCYAVCCAVY